MSNEEFDNLEQELLWQGSKVPVLRCDCGNSHPRPQQACSWAVQLMQLCCSKREFEHKQKHPKRQFMSLGHESLGAVAAAVCLHTSRAASTSPTLTDDVLLPRSSTESKFLQASKAFQVGKSIMPDDEYDQLKKELRKKGSKVTAQARLIAPLLSA